ncbi:unnamed protein product [Closterium sp. NIES-64]|nr:unnamed protein product [Closterium sp. NIES-64]
MAAASPIGQLSDDLLSVILHFVGPSDGQLQHALVCKKWHRIARSVHEHIHLRKERHVSPRELLAHLSSFPGLRKLVLANGSITSVPDSLLSGIADTCPDLTGLHVDKMDRRYRRGGFTENGLSYFFEKCTRLEGLRLDCQSNLTAIPSSIGGLASLKSLHITDRRRIALLPEAFTSLQALTHLVIEMHGLDELPQDFGNLRLLKSLNLIGCQCLVSIPDSLGQLTNLTQLSISDSTRLQLPESISNLTLLLTVEISNCQDLLPLPERFGNLPALETLRLENVWGISNLPASLGQLASLTDLILDRLALHHLPDGVALLPRLRTLKLDVGMAVQLHPSVYLATTLKELTITKSETLHSLPEEFGQLTALEALRLFELSRLSSLPASLGNLTSLKELKISFCRLLTELPDSLTLLSSLELLEISCCRYLTVLPQGMGDGLCSLRRLILLEPRALTHLPPSFSSLSSLETLQICGAPSLRGALPSEFSHMTSLKDLSLSSLPHLPALPASLPAITCTLTSLVVINCTRIEALPEDIGWLGSLESLHLSELPNLKSLPKSLFQLQRLKSLTLFGCSALESLFEDEDTGNALTGAAHTGDAHTGDAHTEDAHTEYARMEDAHTEDAHTEDAHMEDAHTEDAHTGAAGHDLAGRITLLEVPGHTGSSSAAGSCEGSEEGDTGVWLPSLEVLRLVNLPLQQLGPSLGSFSSLTRLEISGLHRLRSLPESISRLSRLQSLTISSADSLLALPETIGKLSALTSLYLTDAMSLTALPESFGQLKKLQSFSIDSSPGLTRLPESFPDLCRLESCYLCEVGISCLPDDFWKLSALKEISLVSLPKFHSLAESFSQLPGLEDLALRECKRLALLPAGLQQMGRLQTCVVSRCPLLSRQRVVIHGTSNLDEGERAVGGSEDEDEGEVSSQLYLPPNLLLLTVFRSTLSCNDMSAANFADFVTNAPGGAELAFLDATLSGALDELASDRGFRAKPWQAGSVRSSRTAVQKNSAAGALQAKCAFKGGKPEGGDGTANLDEGERAVGGSEEEDEWEVRMGEEDEGSEGEE